VNDNLDDPLAPARGVLFGLVIGLAFFAIIGLIVAALI